MRLRIVTIVLMIAVAAGGTFVGSDLFQGGSGGGWSHEAGDAWSAEKVFQVFFDRGRPNFVAVVTARDGDVDDAAVAEAASDLEAQLEDLAVVEAESYWSLGRPDFMKNEEGTAALVLGRVPGASESLADRGDTISDRLRWDRDVISVSLGGDVMTHLDIREGSFEALPAVAVGGLLALLLAALSLRSLRGTLLVAAAMAMAVSATVLALTGLETLVELPALSKVLSVALALGLTAASSYLLVVRFVEERRSGAGRQAAVFATVTTAGRVAAAVAVVAIAIGFTLVALPTALLRSTGFALALTALVSGVAAVVVVGLLLSMFGAGPVTSIEDDSVSGLWHRLTAFLRPRPLITLVVVAALLLPLAFLGVGVRTVEPGPETLASDAASRRTAQHIGAEFPSNDAEAAFILPGTLPETRRSEELTRQYVEAVSNVSGVARVDSSSGTLVAGREIRVPEGFSERYSSEQADYMLVPLIGNAHSAAAEQAVTAIGDLSAPFRTNIGGVTARQIETVSAVSGRALFTFAVALAFVLVLIAGLLRGVRAGLRATLMAVLLGAVTGAVLKIGFADGALGGLLGFAANGSVAVAAGPIAWAVGGIVASSLVIVGWGSVRETIDAAGNDILRVHHRLGATALIHVVATICLALPLAGMLAAGWRTAQLPGAAAVATAVVAATAGRFILLPAFVAFRAASLWPVQADGEVRRVFSLTVASRQWAHAAVAAQPMKRTPPPSTVSSDDEEFAAAPVPDPTTATATRSEGEDSGAAGDVEPSPARVLEVVDDDLPDESERAPETEMVDVAAVESSADDAADTDALDPVFAQLREETGGEVEEEGPDADLVDIDVGADGAHVDVAEPAGNAEPGEVTEADDTGVTAVSIEAEDVVEPVGTLRDEVAEAVDVLDSVAAVEPDDTEDSMDIIEPSDIVESPDLLQPADAETSVETSSVDTSSIDIGEAAELETVDIAETLEAETVDTEPIDIAEPPEMERVATEPVDIGETPEAATEREPIEMIAPADRTAPMDTDAEEPIDIIEVETTAVVDRSEPGAAETVDAEPSELADETEPFELVDETEPFELVDETEPFELVDETEPFEEAVAAPSDDGPLEQVTELHVAGESEEVRREPFALAEEERLPTVDVVSLTQSVIASLEAERAFTTEVGSGFVANPSNNLSRVMEAILRDASTRGGDEVLVYGHASRGRYRWMVVDSGPHAESDPDRARTLAEAQRFIRRVGGVVECRPEGDFTVFVVEIPMAS